jgi:hypothetical protein
VVVKRLVNIGSGIVRSVAELHQIDWALDPTPVLRSKNYAAPSPTPWHTKRNIKTFIHCDAAPATFSSKRNYGTPYGFCRSILAHTYY